MSSLLMRAMRCSGNWHFWQTISKPKVFLRSSAHGTYLDLAAGLLLSSGGVVGVGATSLRLAACDGLRRQPEGDEKYPEEDPGRTQVRLTRRTRLALTG
jgi:hypothetical protein